MADRFSVIENGKMSNYMKDYIDKLVEGHLLEQSMTVHTIIWGVAVGPTLSMLTTTLWDSGYINPLPHEGFGPWYVLNPRAVIEPQPLPPSDSDYTATCEDCDRPYGDQHGFPDLVISDEAWEKIMPGRSGSGLLCPSCMCKRAHDAGIWVKAEFTSGPFQET